MENRVEKKSAERPGAALFALAAIVLITAGWWALALWPAGSAEPEWLARTRSACFGSARGGLPDVSGWILLIGEPLGMLGVLYVMWGASLRRNFEWLWTRRVWRIAGVSAVVITVAFFTTLGIRVARAQSSGAVEFDASSGVTGKLNDAPPDTRLIDQRGRSISLAEMAGTPVLLTFAYGHCSTVCPSVVADLRIARKELRRDDVKIAILTVDPWRDVPERLPTLAEHWKLDDGDLVLSGSVDEVEAALNSLAIGRKRNETTGDIDHGTTVMLIDDTHRIRYRVDGGGRENFAALLSREP